MNRIGARQRGQLRTSMPKACVMSAAQELSERVARAVLGQGTSILGV